MYMSPEKIVSQLGCFSGPWYFTNMERDGAKPVADLDAYLEGRLNLRLRNQVLASTNLTSPQRPGATVTEALKCKR